MEEQESEQLADLTLYALAIANISRYRFEAALGLLRSMEYRDPMALFFIGVCRAMRNEDVEAISAFDEVLAIDPDFYAAAAFGLVLRDRRNDPGITTYAQTTFLPLVRRIAAEAGIEARPLTFLVEEWEQMPAKIQEHVLLIPKNVQEHLFAGLLSKFVKDLWKGIKMINEAVAEGSDRMTKAFWKLEVGQLESHIYRFYLGLTPQEFTSGNRDELRRHIARLCEINPEAMFTKLAAAIFYSEEGHEGPARKYLAEAVKLAESDKPRYVGATEDAVTKSVQMDLCIIYALRGKDREALESLRRALENDQTRGIALKNGVRQLVELSRSEMVLAAAEAEPIVRSWVEYQTMLQSTLPWIAGGQNGGEA